MPSKKPVKSVKPVKVAIGFGVLDKDRDVFLIGKTAISKPYANLWSFPGGKVEKGENPLQAIKREWKEEVGVEPLHVEPEYKSFKLTVNGNLCEFYVFHVICSGKETPVAEAYQELAWIGASEIHKYEHTPASLFFLGLVSAFSGLITGRSDEI